MSRARLRCRVMCVSVHMCACCVSMLCERSQPRLSLGVVRRHGFSEICAGGLSSESVQLRTDLCALDALRWSLRGETPRTIYDRPDVALSARKRIPTPLGFISNFEGTIVQKHGHPNKQLQYPRVASYGLHGS